MAEPTRRAAVAELRTAYQNGGYCRIADASRRSREGSSSYKKGYEVRIVVSTRRELDAIRRALRILGFTTPKSFRKHGKYVQPVYGRDAVDWFSA